MTPRSIFAGLAIGAGLMTATAVFAGNPVTVTGFQQAQAPSFDKDGNPLPKTPATAFKFPVTSTEVGPNGSVGLSYNGKLVFIRKADLKLGAAPPCAKVADQAPRGPGSLKAGERHGQGASTDCMVDGK